MWYNITLTVIYFRLCLMKGVPLIKRLAALLLTAYVVVAGFNYSSTYDVPETTTFLVQTEDGRGNGSAVAIAPNLLLTAGHVAAAGKYVQLYVKLDNRLQPIEVVSIDTNSDLALIRIKGMDDGKWASIDTTIPSIGTSVKAVGYPLNFNIKHQITTEGKVLGTVDDRLMTSVSILPGNSGGGLFATTWYGKVKLVGITVSVPVVPMGFSGLPTFTMSNSVPPNYIWLFLHGNGIEE